MVEKLKKMGFVGVGRCTEEEISKAEKKLGFVFPKEYREFLIEFKAGDICGHELMGVGVMDYADTVYNTIEERDNDVLFPKDCFVLENMGIEGLLVICDKDGKIYNYRIGKKELVSSSLSEYMDYCKTGA